MTLRKLTAIIMIVGFLLVVIYDIVVWVVGGNPATISHVYLTWLEGRPWLIAAPAYLLGHLTWPQTICKKCKDK